MWKKPIVKFKIFWCCSLKKTGSKKSVYWSIDVRLNDGGPVPGDPKSEVFTFNCILMYCNSVDWLQLSWLIATQLIDCNSVDWLQLSWLIATQLTDCNSVDWLQLSWLIATQLIDCNSVDWLQLSRLIATHLIRCRALSPGKRIQYICKQGGQTFLIESSALLDRLRAAGTGSYLPMGIREIRGN
jgi:hypothetical protein